MPLCIIENCGRKRYAHGWCYAHNERLGKKKALRPEIFQRFGRGEQSAAWRGGTRFIDGRMWLYSPDHPHAVKDGTYVLRSRLVMEKHLGRYLKPTEVVHHRNEDPADDRLDNLELFASNAEHMRVRHMANGRWSVKHDACKECGATNRKHAAHGLCINCYHRGAKQ